MEAKSKQRWWPVVKALLGLAILVAVGWRFGRDLAQPQLYAQPIRIGWLVAAALLYLAALSFSALYWHRLLVHLGASPTVFASLRAYFVSQPAKYLPGKAGALVLRVAMIRSQGVSAALGGLTTFVEVLTTMAVGVMVAAVLFALVGPQADDADLVATLRGLMRLDLSPDHPIDRWPLALASLLLVGVTLGPIFPPVFNRLVDRLSLPFRSGPAPRLQLSWLFEGIVYLIPSWLLLGLALACAFAAIPGAELPWDIVTLGRLTAGMGLSYVAGFVLFTPGGLGVREFVLGLLIAPELVLAGQTDAETAAGRVVLAVLLLRVSWTVAELVAAGGLYFCAPESRLDSSATEAIEQRHPSVST